jgi:hypothetical protein
MLEIEDKKAMQRVALALIVRAVKDVAVPILSPRNSKAGCLKVKYLITAYKFPSQSFFDSYCYCTGLNPGTVRNLIYGCCAETNKAILKDEGYVIKKCNASRHSILRAIERVKEYENEILQ